MAKGRDLIRKWIPTFLLEGYRNQKKQRVRQRLEAQKNAGKILTKVVLLEQLKSIGIEEGDSVLVHSSLSKIGYLENGPKDVVDALLEAVGPTGNILMPNSPNASYQLDYIQQLEVFDVKNDASKLGAITEYFRKLPQAIRSQHPTEPVSCPDIPMLISKNAQTLWARSRVCALWRPPDKDLFWNGSFQSHKNDGVCCGAEHPLVPPEL